MSFITRMSISKLRIGLFGNGTTAVSRLSRYLELVQHTGYRYLIWAWFSSQVKTLSDATANIKDLRFNKIVVVAGAGISTASGIPDFRTPGSGLYDSLHKYIQTQLPYPEAIFDIDFFTLKPEPFFAWAKEIYQPGKYRPNVCHYFVRLLQEKGMLLRMYTQNIDGLERSAGISTDKLVEAHGTCATATCRVCYHSYSGNDIKEDILAGKIPRCHQELCNGIVKPDIVFFGEQLPKRFYYFLTDMPRAEMVIIMGTSLEVQPFASIIDVALPGTPRILFNLNPAGPFAESPQEKDVFVPGNLTDSIWKFSDDLGWKEELIHLMKTCNNCSY